MSRSSRLALEQMLDACRRLVVYRTALNFETFSEHGVFYDAVLRQLLVLGESAARVPEADRLRLPDVEFRQIVALRNIVVHRYDAIDDEIVWNILDTKIEHLASRLNTVLVVDDSASSAHE